MQLLKIQTNVEPFDAAYLMMRYKKENAMTELPAFVKKVIIPLIYYVGKLTGRYKKLKNAPLPV
ncbi:MAG: hypothetical protein ABI594_13825 [Ginsengibacter sp.]